MKIVFVSNYYNHHQSFLSEAFFRETDGEYAFVETDPFHVDRKKLGWEINDIPAYVVKSYQSEEDYRKAEKLILEADVVITASPGNKLMRERYKLKKLTFQYSERLFKTGFQPHLWLGRFIKYQRAVGGKSYMYLLATSGYAASDYKKIGLYNHRAYRWAYFPEAKAYDIDHLVKEKNAGETIHILWAGRFIDWKHPELCLETAKHLRKFGINFHLTMIGNGVMLNQMQELAIENNLSQFITFAGAMNPNRVRNYMEKAQIFLFTSDQNEGWGAVLNEAMNSGCAVVADSRIGAVPYLLRDGENGLLYTEKDALFAKVKILAEDSQKRECLGKNAYHTIHDLWNAEVGAKRFITLANEIAEKGKSTAFEDGPCSKI